MEVILRQDVDKVGLRGEVVDVARGYARNFLLPAQARRARRRRRASRELAQGRGAARPARGADASSRRSEIARAARAGRAPLRRQGRARPARSSARSRRPTSPTSSGRSTRCASTGARSADDPIKRIGRYEVPVELFQDVTVEVRTLVVPEGGELPPEEELEAMEAAEAAEAARRPRRRRSPSSSSTSSMRPLAQERSCRGRRTAAVEEPTSRASCRRTSSTAGAASREPD